MHGGYILLVAGETNNVLNLHSIRNGFRIAKIILPTPIIKSQLSRCGRYAVVLCTDRSVHLWDILPSAKDTKVVKKISLKTKLMTRFSFEQQS